jgi:dTDP-4-dehydrorhamnose 3,5-epimerase
VKILSTDISGCFEIRTKCYKDARGWFYESYQKQQFDEALGYAVDFVQDNTSLSGKHVLRGLHYQRDQWAQSKLVHVVRGRVLDVIVDLRPESPSFKKTLILELSGGDGQMLFIPKGLAHGFLSLEDQTVFCYKCDAYYHPEAEAGIRFNDPELNIDWGIPEANITLSDKDLQLPFLKDIGL